MIRAGHTDGDGPDQHAPTVLLADDLTGALDCAAAFAGRGVSSFVSVGRDIARAPRVDLVSVNLDTRRLSARAAAAVVRRTVAGARSAARLGYVKIDSTLRGHPGAEVGAAAAASGAGLVILTPAFPATGRTVEDGRLAVHGVPLAETEVGRDPLSPVATSLVSEVLRRDCRLPLRTCPLDDIRSGRLRDTLAAAMDPAGAQAPSLLVCDAATDADLDRLVAGALQWERPAAPILFAGSAGLASALARATSRGGAPAAGTPTAAPPVLLVSASQRALAGRQFAQLAERRLAEVHALRFRIDGSGQAIRTHFDRQAVSGALAARRSVALRTDTEGGAPSPAESRTTADAISRELAAIVAGLAAEHPIGGLVLVGGDTARAVLSAIEAAGIVLAGEVEPGTPVGAIAGGPLDGVTIATKAGAFGDDGTLVRLFHRLDPHPEGPPA